MIFPVSTSPVSETSRTSGCVTIRSPTGTPSPVTTFSTPARQHVRGQLGEAKQRERRLLGRLQHLRVPRRERRRELPDRHHQRVVPRRDPADDAERLAADHRGVAAHVLARALALEQPRGAREEAHVVDARSASRRARRRAACRRSPTRSPRAPRRSPRAPAPARAAPRRARPASCRATPAAPPSPPRPPRRRPRPPHRGTTAIISSVAGFEHLHRLAGGACDQRLRRSPCAAYAADSTHDHRALHVVVHGADVVVGARLRERELVALDHRRPERVREDAGVVEALSRSRSTTRRP